MKKITALWMVFFVCTTTVFAQAYEGRVDYQKVSQPAVMIEYKYPQEIVESALKSKMSTLNVKGKTSKDFYTYTGAVIPEISNSSLDYAFKVAKKSKKEKDITVIYLVINGMNALSSENEVISANAKTFLNNLVKNVEQSNLEQQIREQEEAVTKAEKKLKGLQDDKADYEKKIRKLQDDIVNNQKDQESQQNEITRQRQLLEALKAKRNG